MPTPQQIEQALGKVRNQRSFLHELLAGALGWPIPDQIENLGEIAYDWSEAELRTEGLDRHIAAGTVLQLQPFRADQPWGVFLLEFKNPDVFTTGRGMTGPLRKVLRGLLPRKRAIKDPNLKSFHREDLLFICTHNYQYFRFAFFKAPAGETKTAPLAAFGWSLDEPARTACELNLPELAWPERDVTPADWVNRWAGAFDVEKVTKRFYEDYKEAFEAVEKLIAQQGDLDTTEDLRLFTQTLFNRLMFLRFIERKNWLELNGRHDYLRALFEAGPAPRQSLYKSRIRTLFFEGLAVEGANKPPEIGSVPFLNGGLFEQSALDKKVKDIPDEAFAPIIASDGLFYRYNFTVEESTPLDIEVAVDPEMLGKVFEELVTGRHESGSYYTPRPVVSFMCREALKGYLAGKCVPPVPTPAESGKAKAASGGTGGTIADSIAALIDRHEVKGLNESHARRILDALDNLKAVDPACGSGAYLLGLLHELIALYRLLYSEKLVKDSRSLYDLKLRIISHNLYGVDIDPFATNTAMLRLWLSLAVDADEPLPLPNLDFKIETGDSLAGPCEVQATHLDFLGLRINADALVDQKDRYLRAHGDEKAALRQVIQNMEKGVKLKMRSLYAEGIIDWRVSFADVLGKQGGFDIVLANPPYVRQELIKELKPRLKEMYPEVYTGTADLYCYFYARAIQLLRKGGMLAFISSNKWFRAGYGQKLRSVFARDATVQTILDFHDLPVFESAIAYPMIFIATKRCPPTNHAPTLVEPPTLEPPYPDIGAVVVKHGQALPSTALGTDGTWRLVPLAAATQLRAMRSAGPMLREFIGNRVYRGITTGLNEAWVDEDGRIYVKGDKRPKNAVKRGVFFIDDETRQELLARDPLCSEIIKPAMGGEDIKRWRSASNTRWLIVTKIGVDMERYTAVMEHLKSFEAPLKARDDQGDEWWELRSCTYYNEFDKPKIVSTKVSIEPTFTYDREGRYLRNTAYVLPVPNIDALYLLGVLNSSSSKFYARSVFVEKQNGWYEVQPTALEEMPIPMASAADRAEITALAQRCLDAQGVNCEAWEKEIDERVAALYGL